MTVEWTPDRIRLLIERSGKTQRAFAEAVHVTPDAVRKWLRGDRTPRTHTQKQLNWLYARLRDRSD